MLMVGRSFESGTSYRYGFNGKENDDEINGNNNAIDFGARIYDPRLGRWFTIDALAKENVPFSAYSYADNNPIIFIDVDGNFRMSKRDQKNYPQLTNMLKNIQQVVKDDPQVWEAFKANAGLTDEEAHAILEWGKGPKIIVAMTGTNLGVTSKTGKSIALHSNMVSWLEGTSPSILSQEGTVFLVYAKLLHEGQHAADKKFKKNLENETTYNPNDPLTELGFQFEVKAFGFFISLDSDNKQPTSRHPDVGAVKYNRQLRSAMKNSDVKLDQLLNVDSSIIQGDTPKN